MTDGRKVITCKLLKKIGCHDYLYLRPGAVTPTGYFHARQLGLLNDPRSFVPYGDLVRSYGRTQTPSVHIQTPPGVPIRLRALRSPLYELFYTYDGGLPDFAFS